MGGGVDSSDGTDRGRISTCKVVVGMDSSDRGTREKGEVVGRMGSQGRQ